MTGCSAAVNTTPCTEFFGYDSAAFWIESRHALSKLSTHIPMSGDFSQSMVMHEVAADMTCLVAQWVTAQHQSACMWPLGFSPSLDVSHALIIIIIIIIIIRRSS